MFQPAMALIAKPAAYHGLTSYMNERMDARANFLGTRLNVGLPAPYQSR